MITKIIPINIKEEQIIYKFLISFLNSLEGVIILSSSKIISLPSLMLLFKYLISLFSKSNIKSPFDIKL